MQSGLFAIAVTLASSSPSFMAESPAWPTAFTEYCDAVRAELHADPDGQPIDPMRLPSGAKFFTLPTVNEILGQRVGGSSRRERAEGRVGLGLIITPLRRADFVRVIESSGNVRLDEEALHAVRGADFTPAWLDGEFVSSCIYLPVTFRVD